ncbi:hypothetical protein ACR3UD_001805 [Escherichia coli]
MNNNMLPPSASSFMRSTEKVTERLTFRGRPVENNRDISDQIVDQVEPQECY